MSEGGAIKIEDGIPIPTGKVTSRDRQAIRSANVGQSFVTDVSDVLYMHARKEGKKIRTRRLEGNKVRVWVVGHIKAAD